MSPPENNRIVQREIRRSEDAKQTAAIYLIRNTRNQKVYIGSAIDVEARWRIHRHQLRNGKHHSRHLQRAWDCHGEQHFEFIVQETVDEDTLIQREQFWIWRLRSCDPLFGYNIAPSAGSQKGYKHTLASRQRMSEAGRGRVLPDEWRASISQAIRGKGIKRSDAQRNRLADLRARLSKTDVRDLLDSYNAGESQNMLAQKFDLSLAAINHIIHGKSFHQTVAEWCQDRDIKTPLIQPSGRSMLKKHDLVTIYEMKMQGRPHKDIARRYDISQALVSAILHGKLHRRIFDEWVGNNGVARKDVAKISRRPSKLSDEALLMIRQDIKHGKKQRDIARMYGVTPATICDIKKGRIYRHVPKR